MKYLINICEKHGINSAARSAVVAARKTAIYRLKTTV